MKVYVVMVDNEELNEISIYNIFASMESANKLKEEIENTQGDFSRVWIETRELFN